VGHGLNAHPVVQHRLHKGVLRQTLQDRHGQRAATDDVAGLAGVGVTPPVGGQVADQHQIGAAPLALALHHGHQGIGSMGGPGLSLGGSPPDAVAMGVQAVHQSHADLGRQGPGQAHHPLGVAPVAELPGCMVTAVQLVGIGGGQPPPADLVSQLGQRRLPGQGQQLRLVLRSAGTDRRHLLQGQLARGQRRPQGRIRSQCSRGLQRPLGRRPSRAAHPGQPLGGVGEALPLVATALRSPGAGPGLRRRAGLLGQRQRVGESRGVLS